MRSGNALRLLTAALALTVSAGCSRFFDAIEEEVEQRVIEAAPGEVPDEPPVVAPEDLLNINSVVPARGETTGGLLVEIVGFGFQEDMRIVFGNVEANPGQVVFISDTRVQCVTPAQAAPGVVPVRVLVDGLAALREDGFDYYEKVTVTGIEPTRGPTEGGTSVSITGTGFVEGTTVQFGNQPALEATVISSTMLTLRTPPLAVGNFAVTVQNYNGAETLPAAFRTYDRVTATQITPSWGPLAGAIPLTVKGTGFIPGTLAWLGSQSVTAIATNNAENQLTGLVPAAVPASEGAVDLDVANDNGVAKLDDGFVYIDTADTTPRVISLAPSTGLLDGGRTVTLVGVGIDAAPLTVTFDGLPATCTIDSDYVATCTTPPGREGAVDVRVTNGNFDVTLPGAFRYIPLRLDALLPARGAVAGGTYVALYGNGFGPDTQLYFGDRAATQVTLLVADDELSAKTPPGAVGRVPLRIVTQGVEITQPDAFEYFDPAQGSTWTSGGSIDGAVNVTVIDGGTGAALPGAFVLIGERPTNIYQGFTDNRGQLTLSGPDLIGAQTVTAAREQYASFSWIKVDAQNLKLMLTPTASSSSGGGGQAPPPAILRGKISRIKDPYNYGDDIVIVTTTYIDFSIPLPNPGPRSQLINNGPYELRARNGEMVVIAMAGRINSASNAFEAHALGFYPFLSTENGQTYENIDITIDTPLSQTLRIELDNPPLTSHVDPTFIGVSPNTAAAFIYYDFGGMGKHPMADIAVPNSDVMLVPMPKRLPGGLEDMPFTVLAGAYLGFDSDGNPATPPSLYPPQSEVYLELNTDTSRTLVATPMLGTQWEIEPSSVGTVGDNVRFAFAVNRTVEPSGNVHALFEAAGLQPVLKWLAVSPGYVSAFKLPTLPSVAGNVNLPESYYYWQLMGMFSEGIVFTNMDVNQLFNWHSRALYVAQFLLTGN